jgi:hypothetical protein
MHTVCSHHMTSHTMEHTKTNVAYLFKIKKKKISLTLNGASVTLPSQVQYMKQVMKLQIIINQISCTVNKVVPVHAMKACNGR